MKLLNAEAIDTSLISGSNGGTRGDNVVAIFFYF